jgi:hypothetical protein
LRPWTDLFHFAHRPNIFLKELRTDTKLFTTHRTKKLNKATEYNGVNKAIGNKNNRIQGIAGMSGVAGANPQQHLFNANTKTRTRRV